MDKGRDTHEILEVYISYFLGYFVLLVFSCHEISSYKDN